MFVLPLFFSSISLHFSYIVVVGAIGFVYVTKFFNKKKTSFLNSEDKRYNGRIKMAGMYLSNSSSYDSSSCSITTYISDLSSYQKTHDDPRRVILFCDFDKHYTMTFTLQQKLTTIYAYFDTIRSEYGIEKVPSTGSSYIAISRHQSTETSDHVVAMSRFAAACQRKLRTTVFPFLSNCIDDEAIRTIRFGIHFGHMTDSSEDVREPSADHFHLRSNIEKAMFLQSTSLSGEIQICKATAKHLKAIGMESSLDRRTDGRLVFATYWLRSESNNTNITHNLIPYDV